ncbi:ornithine cyclodeaminase [Novosphingobium decolorationis]|uniref:Ornithine cyclodeaminase n=1 Tax=Novosphingobium decolorationis TaxID=2698673 RepID=A0ABX8E4U5_9SPHN|nr:ornithine cyclodeaminase [Novosphingobium decolorationis]MED5543968.1 ornithine cyclodeaminase [Pseudomonadota bacterium]QVM84123.1 ornithine cyclodeaminase [Novosphingobium decolorationis]
MVPFIGVADLAEIVEAVGLEAFLRGLAERIEADFERWEEFDKSPRYASHVPGGVIELMPAADREYFAFKQVNGHPGNTAAGLQTVAALGVLTRVDTGYPVMVSEMTLLTALRTAAMSALVARYLARPASRVLAMIGQGAQSEFQATAFKALLGITRVQAWDIDTAASRKFARNLADSGIEVVIAPSADEAVIGADIVTTVTADKVNARILSANMTGAGLHINAVGGDCPGKTELAPEILQRGRVFVEYTPQTRIEGEIQQMPDDFEVTELWSVFSGKASGRTSDEEITIFDSVGFGIEDFSALRYLYDLLPEHAPHTELDLIAQPQDPRDLFGLLAPRQPAHA